MRTKNRLGSENHGRTLIAGVPVNEVGPHNFVSSSRLDGQPIGNFHSATTEQIDAAVSTAYQAYLDVNVRSPMTADDHAKALLAIAAEFEADLANIRLAGEHECGYPAGRSDGETKRQLYQLRFHAEAVRRRKTVFPSISITPDGKTINLRRIRVAKGVAFCGPSTNFPWAIGEAGPDLIEPLSLGCSVVAKASSKHPLTAELMASAVYRGLEKAGHPLGRFSMIQSNQGGVGEQIFGTGLVAAGGYTGAGARGIALAQVAFQHGAMLHVEGDSTNPVFAQFEYFAQNSGAFADTWFGSLTMGNGQFCTKPGLAIVPAGNGFAAFETALRAKVESAPCGTLLNPGTDSGYADGIQKIEAITGKPWIQSKNEPSGLAKCRPAIYKITFGEFKAAGKKAQIEIFAAVGLVITVESINEMIELAGLLGSQLTACLHGTAEEKARPDAMQLRRILAYTKAGRFGDGIMPTGVILAPGQVHGGPFGATTFGEPSMALSTRFSRPICFDSTPDELLPAELQNENPLGIQREVFVVSGIFGETLYWETTALPISAILEMIKK